MAIYKYNHLITENLKECALRKKYIMIDEKVIKCYPNNFRGGGTVAIRICHNTVIVLAAERNIM